MHPQTLDIEKLSRDALVTVLDALPIAAFLIEKRHVHCNLASAKITGYDSGEITTASDFFNLLFATYIDGPGAIFESASEVGVPESRDCTITRKDGSTAVVRLSCSGSNRLICTMQDVTASSSAPMEGDVAGSDHSIYFRNSREASETRGNGHGKATTTADHSFCFNASPQVPASKPADDAYQDSGELFDLLLEHCPAYLIVKDENHKVLRLSRNFETLLGRPLEELIGTRAEEIFPPELAERIRLDDLRVLRSGHPSYVEEELRGRSYSSLKFAIVNRDKPSLIIAIKTDITERRKKEDAIRRLNEKLDRRIAERTAELEAAILEQESFSYSVSHDLRAPLRHINSYGAILLEDYSGILPEQARDYLDRLRSATSRMGVLIDDLLELSRVSRVFIKRVPVNLSEVVDRVGLLLQETEPERRVTFSILPDVYASCDLTLVRQLFENLIGNAWKYTGKVPEAHIEFGMEATSERTVFFVKDNGAGFDMAYKNKLFSPFQRLHGAEFEGNGIGLATAERIVHRHGGSIWAEGAENEGARFYFTLS